MCNRCENITPDTSHIYYIDGQSGKRMFFLWTGDRYYDTEIEYCPFCGRKLGEKV